MDYKIIIANALAEIINKTVDTIVPLLATPPNHELGDYAYPCFSLAKEFKKAPSAIAQDLIDKITEAHDEVFCANIEKMCVVGGYLNFYIDKAGFVRDILTCVLQNGISYGSSNIGGNRTVCLDYSSINIAKPFHIGHLSTTVIGNSLSRIYKHLGYNTVSINHLGDWGTQFGKLIVAYKRWGNKEEVDNGSVMALMELYVRYHEEAKTHPEMDDEARAWFKRIEDGDAEAIELFDWFKELTLKSAQKVYDLLGVKFDSYAGESFYTPYMSAVVEQLRDKGLLKVDNGASIVDLSAYDMPPCLILKSDGATLYATRDITTAIYRKETYDFCKLLYVVAYQQDLHFRQFFKVLELMGADWVRDCQHVSYGMVSLEDGSMSTREGRVVLLEEVLSRAIEKTRAVIEAKNPDLENKDEVAKQVGVGAVVWSPLYNNRIKDIVFSWDKSLNFDGETAPYAQYTHARCCSVLKKCEVFGKGTELIENLDGTVLNDEESVALVKSIAAFPESICLAAEKNEPYLIARRVIDVCVNFNRFYYDHRIMDVDKNIKNARLALCAATRSVIKIGLYLLGIEAPEKM